MPGGLTSANNDKSIKRLKQAQLPFKVLSSVTTASTSSTGKVHSIKKRPFAKDETGNTKTALPKKAKTSSDAECVEVSSSSDEPRAVSPRRRSRAPLDQFVRVESPVSEVSTSCDLVDLTGENKENRAEPQPADAEMTEVTVGKAGEGAEIAGKEVEGSAEVTQRKVGRDVEVTNVKVDEHVEIARGEVCGDAEGNVSEDAEVTQGKISEDVQLEKTAANYDVNKVKADDAGKLKTEELDMCTKNISGKNVPEKETLEPDDISIMGAGEACDGPEECVNASKALNSNADENADASVVECAAEPDTVRAKSDYKSDISQVKSNSKNTEGPSTSHDRNATEPMSDPKKESPGEGYSSSADRTSATAANSVQEAESPKTSRPNPGTDDQASADASDSEKDTDADDESADDVVVLDGVELKPAEEDASGKAGISTTPSTKRLGITKRMTPKQKERQRLRAKREQEKLEEKQRRREEKDKIRKGKQEQKEKERKEIKEKREKERKEKEDQKEKERLEKQKEKLEKQKQREAEKQKLIDEKRQAKEEKKSQKEEEKRRIEEEEQKKLQKAKSMFSNFFVKKPKEAEVEQEEQKEEDNKLFQEFRVKEDMVLAPGTRAALSAGQSSRLERALAESDRPPSDQLYLAELRAGLRQPQSRSRTLPPLQKDLEIIEEDDEVDRELDGLAQNIVLSSAAATSRQLRFKLLMFHENRRPAYWGTWSKRSRVVSGRRPLGRAQILNYDEDSDDDWEEEDPNGESLSGSEKEVESEDDYEVDNEYFVPHGYLSDEEIKDAEEIISPEAQKARLKEKGEEFEKQMKKKTTALKPRLIGCVWQDEANTDPMFQQLLKLLRPFAVRPLSELPVPTVASGEADGTPLAGPSPPETPASSAQQIGLKFLKKFPDEALLPLARLVHGSTRGKPLLVREFAVYWKRLVNGGSPRKADATAAPPSTIDGTPPGTGGPVLSKKKIEDKLCEIAAYSRCTAEGPLQGRCCWMVRQDVLDTLGTELPLPSEWKWITKTAARRSQEVTPGSSPAAVVAGAAGETEAVTERPRPATSLITKFTKVVTAEEARSELLSPPPAKRKIVPTKLISPQPPAPGQPAQPGIATFFKTSPSAGAGLQTSGTPQRRLAPTPVEREPGPSAAPGRRVTLTPVSAGAAAPARRLTPTAVPPAARRLIPTPVATGQTVSTAAPTAGAGSMSAQGRPPAHAPAPAVSAAPETAPRKVTLISVPFGLPELAKVAAAPGPAATETKSSETTPASADVEMITLD